MKNETLRQNGTYNCRMSNRWCQSILQNIFSNITKVTKFWNLFACGTGLFHNKLYIFVISDSFLIDCQHSRGDQHCASFLANLLLYSHEADSV
jgi:hypothetical protein